MMQIHTISLTPTQVKVLTLMSQGLESSIIAQRLAIGMGTLATHRTNIYRRLNVLTAQGAIDKATKLGLIK